MNLPRLRTRLWLSSAIRFFRWRGPVVILVFAMGLTAFLIGTEVTDRELDPTDVMGMLYYTIGLFVLGGLDLGVPSGGPFIGRALLWVAYFAAPAITASAVVEGFIRALRRDAWRSRPIRNHIVIAGCGRLAMLYLQRLREIDENRQVIVVELETNGALAEEAKAAYGAQIVWGDIGRDAVLESMRLQRATRVMLLTGNDYTNLDAAARILERSPELRGRVVAHVADIRMARVIESHDLLEGCEVFNSHHVAATELVDSKVLEHFRATEPRDAVVLAGFGRFGQTVLDQLQRRAKGAFDTVVIVDIEARRLGAIFDEQIGFHDSYDRSLIDGDLRDPELWKRLHQDLDLDHIEPVFLLGSGDDSTNIQTAIWLRDLSPSAFIVARTFGDSVFASRVAEVASFQLVSVSDLLCRRMPRQWFESS